MRAATVSRLNPTSVTFTGTYHNALALKELFHFQKKKTPYQFHRDRALILTFLMGWSKVELSIDRVPEGCGKFVEIEKNGEAFVVKECPITSN